MFLLFGVMLKEMQIWISETESHFSDGKITGMCTRNTDRYALYIRQKLFLLF